MNGVRGDPPHAPFATSERRRCKILAYRFFASTQFVDTQYTRGYTSWFLAVTALLARWCHLGKLGRGAALPLGRGGVAQLGERLNGIQEVRGSIPLASMAWQLDAGRLVDAVLGRLPRCLPKSVIYGRRLPRPFFHARD